MPGEENREVKEPKWSGRARHKVHAAASAIRVARKKKDQWSPVIATLILSRQRIDSTLLAREPSLVATRWLPYRYESAYRCTELFAGEYVEAFKKAVAKHQDSRRADSRRPASADLALNSPSEIVSFWKARQKADEMGVSYPFFIRVAIETALEERKYKRVPRPNQLCNPWQIRAIKEEWDRLEETRGLFADDWDPRFFSSNSRGGPPQLAAREALYKRIMGRPADQRALALWNYLGSAVTFPDAEAMFGPELVAEACRGRVPSSPPEPAQTPASYLPPCLGLRKIAAATACLGCPYTPLCDGISSRVGSALIANTGTDDPRQAEIRESNRIRKAKQRAKEKAARVEAVQQSMR